MAINENVDKFKESLRANIQKNNDPNTKEYMDLFVAINRVIRQGSGLTWSAIDEIVETEILKYKYDLK